MSALMKSSVKVTNHWLSSLLNNQILTSFKRHQEYSVNKASGSNTLNFTRVLNTQREKLKKLSMCSFQFFKGLKINQRTFQKGAAIYAVSKKEDKMEKV